MEQIKNREYHHHFNFSILFYIKEILGYLFLIIIGVVIYFWYFKSIALLVTVSILGLLIASTIKKYNKELIKISRRGIWLRGKSFFYWRDIESMKIDKVNYTFSSIFGDEDNFDNLVIYFKAKTQKEVSINIHGMKDRETLVALADNYIEINKNDKI